MQLSCLIGALELTIFHNFDGAFVREWAMHQHAFEYLADVTLSSLMFDA